MSVKQLINQFIQRANRSLDNYSIAKHTSDLGKQFMERNCECGHKCRDHNFVNAKSKEYPEAKIADSCKTCECIKFKHKKEENDTSRK